MIRSAFIFFYFCLLAFLAIYGFHIFWLISIYYRRRNQNPVSECNKLPLDYYPHVTVQLPIYNEKIVASRLINAIASFDWPRNRLEIQVLDDSDDDTTSIVKAEVNRLDQDGIDIKHICRNSREGYKAGALAHGLSQAKGEFIAIFDADNLPRPDFIKSLIGYFDNPQIGMVQARWSFLNRNESILCRAQALFLDSHFFVEQVARCRGGLFMNFNGTAGIWRKKAIDDAGGWQADTLTEDLDLSYRSQLAGWKMLFLENIDVPTELPSSIRSFKTQQYRWARGAIETGIKNLPHVFRSSFPWPAKISAFFHLTQKSVSLALLMLSVMLIPALYIRMESGMLKLLLIDLPIFLAGTGSMSIFYGIAFKKQRQIRSFKNSLVLPMLTSVGVALAINNSLALLAALSRRRGKGIFIRTPKTGAGYESDSLLPSDYRIRFDNTVKFEILLAGYSIAAIACALVLKLFFSVPFLLTFAFGFTYFTIMSLKEKYA